MHIFIFYNFCFHAPEFSFYELWAWHKHFWTLFRVAVLGGCVSPPVYHIVGDQAKQAARFLDAAPVWTNSSFFHFCLV